MCPLRRIGYTGSPEAIEQVPGIARGRDIMAQGSQVVVRSGSGASSGGRGDALPMLLKCEWGDVGDLEMIIEPRAAGVCWGCGFGGGRRSVGGVGHPREQNNC